MSSAMSSVPKATVNSDRIGSERCRCFDWGEIVNENRTEVWEKKTLRKIFFAALDNGEWKIRTNTIVYTLCGEPDVVTQIKEDGQDVW